VARRIFRVQRGVRPVLTPTVKGSIAEAVIAAEAVKAGIVVLRPVVEGRRYDLVFDLGDRMLRVQCKSGRLKGGVVAVHTRTSRHTPRGYVWTTYQGRRSTPSPSTAPSSTAAICSRSSSWRAIRRSTFGSWLLPTISGHRYTLRPTSPFLGL
jgi:PD-(D/E)XK endonuclease